VLSGRLELTAGCLLGGCGHLLWFDVGFGSLDQFCCKELKLLGWLK
jgi:hypothetical protein